MAASPASLRGPCEAWELKHRCKWEANCVFRHRNSSSLGNVFDTERSSAITKPGFCKFVRRSSDGSCPNGVMCARVHVTTDDTPVAPSIGNAIVLVHLGALKRGPAVTPQQVTMAQLKKFLAQDSLLKRPLTNEEVISIVLGAPICERFLVDGHCPRKTFCPESKGNMLSLTDIFTPPEPCLMMLKTNHCHHDVDCLNLHSGGESRGNAIALGCPQGPFLEPMRMEVETYDAYISAGMPVVPRNRNLKKASAAIQMKRPPRVTGWGDPDRDEDDDSNNSTISPPPAPVPKMRLPSNVREASKELDGWNLESRPVGDPIRPSEDWWTWAAENRDTLEANADASWSRRGGGRGGIAPARSGFRGIPSGRGARGAFVAGATSARPKAWTQPLLNTSAVLNPRPGPAQTSDSSADSTPLHGMSRASTAASSIASPKQARRPALWPHKAIARIAELMTTSVPRPRDATKEAAATLTAVRLALPLLLVCKSWKLAAEPKVYARVGTTSLESCAKLVRVLFDRVILLDYVKAIDLDLPARSIDSIAMLISAAGHALDSLQVSLRDDDGPDYTPAFPGDSFGASLRTASQLKRFTFLSTRPFNLSGLLDVCGPMLKTIDISGLSPASNAATRQQDLPRVERLILREPSADLGSILVHFPALNHVRIFTDRVTVRDVLNALQSATYPALRLLEVEAPRSSSWGSREELEPLHDIVDSIGVYMRIRLR